MEALTQLEQTSGRTVSFCKFLSVDELVGIVFTDEKYIIIRGIDAYGCPNLEVVEEPSLSIKYELGIISENEYVSEQNSIKNARIIWKEESRKRYEQLKAKFEQNS